MKKSNGSSRASGTRFAAIALVVSLVASAASAQDLASELCAPEVPEGQRRALLVREGVTGIWFHADVARCMLERLAAFPIYEERIVLLSTRLALDDRRIENLRDALKMAEDGERRALGALESSERRAREAEEARDAWHRSPLLWFAVGAVVSVAVVGVGAYAASSL